jgi:hypothetical protein
MAISLPNVRVMKVAPASTTAPLGQRLQYVAFFSEYNCAPMPPKTFCALGLCLRSSPDVRKANVQVQSMKFVYQENGEPLLGFEPKANPLTARSFRARKSGVWFGFSSLFQRQVSQEGGVEMKVEFSAAPGTSDDAIKTILADAFIGAAGGNKDGKVVEGHHLEIVKVGKIAMVVEQRKSASR